MYLKYFGGREAVQRRFVDLAKQKLLEIAAKESDVQPPPLGSLIKLMEQLNLPYTLFYNDYSAATAKVIGGCMDFLGIGWDEILGDCQLTDNDIVEVTMQADAEQFFSVSGPLTIVQRAKMFAITKAIREL